MPLHEGARKALGSGEDTIWSPDMGTRNVLNEIDNPNTLVEQTSFQKQLSYLPERQAR